MKKNRLFTSCTLLLTAVLLLASCSNGASSAPPSSESSAAAPTASQQEESIGGTDEKIVLSYAIPLDATTDTGWDQMLTEANKLLEPKNIEISPLRIAMKDWPDYYQKVASMFAAGQSPDLGRAAERLMPSFIAKGQALDITEQLKDLDMSLYYEKAFQASSYSDGKYYGIPSGIYFYILYFNKDLFDAAGLPYPSADWSNPSNFSLIEEYAEKLTTGSGADKVYGFYCDPRPQHIGMFSSIAGGESCYDSQWNPTLNGESTKQIYRWFDGLIQKELIPRPTETRILGPDDMFIQGKLAMLVQGTWLLSKVATVENFQPGYAAIPVPDGAAGSQTLQFVDAFLIYSGTRHPDEAWEAMKAIASKEAETALATSTVAGTSIYKEANELYMNDILSKMTTPEELDMFTGALDVLQSMPYNENWEESLQMALNVRDEWLLGKMTPDDYADEVQRIYEKVKSEAE